MSRNILGSNTTTSDTNNNNTSNKRCRIEIRGWRKRTLYLLFFILILLTVINLGLVIWIMKILKFTTTGMGPINIMSDGMELTGQTLIMDSLRASRIFSKSGQPISIDSYRNFTINTRNEDGYIANRLFLGHDRVVFHVNNFLVSDTNGNVIFNADHNHVDIAADVLRLNNDGGVVFRESIQTPLISADIGKDIKLESPTRGLDIKATEGIWIQSSAGSVDAECYDDLKLYSSEGSIRIDAQTILIPNLKRVRDDSSQNIYQLCSCDSGKLFLAPSESSCYLDEKNAYVCS